MFSPRTFQKPAPCDLCGGFIVGAAVQCAGHVEHAMYTIQLTFTLAGCKFNAHSTCAQHAPALCGHDFSEKNGRLRIEINFEQVSPTVVCLDINVAEAKNLTPGTTGPPSSYLKVTLRPDPEDHRLRKTEPIKRNAEPVFNESFKYFV